MSEIIMIAATVVMAIFAGLSYCLSRQIKKDGSIRDAEVRELFIKLTTGIMASGKTAGYPEPAARLFEQHEAALRKSFDKPKELLPPQGR